MHVDLNADVGEGGPYDAELMTLISSANIACGGHAGDEGSMRQSVAQALAAAVAIGAHPGYPDRENFGRTPRAADPAVVHDLVRAQVSALAAIVRTQGGRLCHVKPHGALYNQAAKDPALADAIAAAICSVDGSLALVGLAGSALPAAAARAGLRAVSEAFADRGYLADGSLVPRGEPDALIRDAAEIRRRALAFVRDGTAIARGGVRIAVLAQTICIHGDSEGAGTLARSVRAALDEAGVDVRAP